MEKGSLGKFFQDYSQERRRACWYPDLLWAMYGLWAHWDGMCGRLEGGTCWRCEVMCGDMVVGKGMIGSMTTTGLGMGGYGTWVAYNKYVPLRLVPRIE